MYGWPQWNSPYGSMQPGGPMNAYRGQNMGMIGPGWAAGMQQAQSFMMSAAMGRGAAMGNMSHPMGQGYNQNYGMGAGGGYGRIQGGGGQVPMDNATTGMEGAQQKKDLEPKQGPDIGSGQKPLADIPIPSDIQPPPEGRASKESEPPKQLSAKDAKEEERLSQLKKQAQQWQVQQKKWLEYQEQVQMQQQAAYRQQMNYQQQQQQQQQPQLPTPQIQPLIAQVRRDVEGNTTVSNLNTAGAQYQQRASLPSHGEPQSQQPASTVQQPKFQQQQQQASWSSRSQGSSQDSRGIHQQGQQSHVDPKGQAEPIPRSSMSRQSMDIGGGGVRPDTSTDWATPTKEVPRASAPVEDAAKKALAEFEKQLNSWNESFELWREQNMDHPDREAYYRYEKQWQAWRDQLVQRHAQMKRLCEEKRSVPGADKLADPFSSKVSEVQSETHLMERNVPDEPSGKPETLQQALSKKQLEKDKLNVPKSTPGAPVVSSLKDTPCAPKVREDMFKDVSDQHGAPTILPNVDKPTGHVGGPENVNRDAPMSDDMDLDEPEFDQQGPNVEDDGPCAPIRRDPYRDEQFPDDGFFVDPRGHPKNQDPNFERGRGGSMGQDSDFDRSRGPFMNQEPNFERLGRGRPMGLDPDFERLGRGRPMSMDSGFERGGRGRMGMDSGFERGGRGRPIGRDPDFERTGRGGPTGLDPDFERVGRGRPMGMDPDFERVGRGRPMSMDPDFERVGRGRPMGLDPDFEQLGRGRPMGLDPTFERLGRGRPMGLDPDFERMDHGRPLGQDSNFERVGRGHPMNQNIDFERGGRGRPMGLDPDFERLDRGHPLGQDPDFEQGGRGRFIREQFFDDSTSNASNKDSFYGPMRGPVGGRGFDEMGPAPLRGRAFEEQQRGRFMKREFGYDDEPGPTMNRSMFDESRGLQMNCDANFEDVMMPGQRNFDEQYGPMMGRGRNLEGSRGMVMGRGANFDDDDFESLRRDPNIDRIRNQSMGRGLRFDESRGRSMGQGSDWDTLQDPFLEPDPSFDQRRALMNRRPNFNEQQRGPLIDRDANFDEWPDQPMNKDPNFEELADSHLSRDFSSRQYDGPSGLQQPTGTLPEPRKIPPLMAFEELETMPQIQQSSKEVAKPNELTGHSGIPSQKSGLVKDTQAEKSGSISKPPDKPIIPTSKEAKSLPSTQKNKPNILQSSEKSSASTAAKAADKRTPATGSSKTQAAPSGIKAAPEKFSFVQGSLLLDIQGPPIPPVLKSASDKGSVPEIPGLQGFDTSSLDTSVPVIDLSGDEDFTADVGISTSNDKWQSERVPSIQKSKDGAIGPRSASVAAAKDMPHTPKEIPASNVAVQSRLQHLADDLPRNIDTKKLQDCSPRNIPVWPAKPSLLGMGPPGQRLSPEAHHEKLLGFQDKPSHMTDKPDPKEPKLADVGHGVRDFIQEPEQSRASSSPKEAFDNGVFQYDDYYVFFDNKDEGLIKNNKEWSVEDETPRKPLLSTPGMVGKEEEKDCSSRGGPSAGKRSQQDSQRGPPKREDSPVQGSRRSRGKSRFSSSPPRRSESSSRDQSGSKSQLHDQPRRAPLLPLPSDKASVQGFGSRKEARGNDALEDRPKTSGQEVPPRATSDQGSAAPLAVAGAITRLLTEEEQEILRRAAEELKALQDMKEPGPTQKSEVMSKPPAEKLRGPSKWDFSEPDQYMWNRDAPIKGSFEGRDQSRGSYWDDYGVERDSDWNRYGPSSGWGDQFSRSNQGNDFDTEPYYRDESSQQGGGTDRPWERGQSYDDSWDQFGRITDRDLGNSYVAPNREPEFRLSESIITIDYGHKSSAAAQLGGLQSSDVPKPEPLDYLQPLPTQPAFILGKMETIDYGHGQKALKSETTATKESEPMHERPPLRGSPQVQPRASPQIPPRASPQIPPQSAPQAPKERKITQLVPRQVERKYIQERLHDKDRDRDYSRERDRDRDRTRERERDRDRDRSRSSRDPDRDYAKRREDPKESSSGAHRDVKPREYRPTFPIDTSRATKSSFNKSELVLIEDLLSGNARRNRPPRIVVILRGLPGSGKTFVAKLIKDKEVENGGTAPRMLCLDDYFMIDTEKTEIEKETGKKVKVKVLEYEYEPEMEESYRGSLFKSFKKTVEDGFFPFIIIDAINDKVKHFEEMWSFAKQKGFQVYIAEMDMDGPACHKRNIHSRTLDEINKMISKWETTPRHYLRVDVRSLLQDAAITEVEMEDLTEEGKSKTEDKEVEIVPPDKSKGSPEVEIFVVPSKWEKMEATEEKLAKLDGLKSMKRKREVPQSLEDYLQLPDDYEQRESQPGKKRVRWADIEEGKDQERRRAVGFVVGQTDWKKLTDPTHAQRALTRTKYI